MNLRAAALATATAAVLAFAPDARPENKRLAPIPKTEATSTHGPFEMGACETCHQRHDADNPGAAVKVSNDLCYDCHDEFKGSSSVKTERSLHPKAGPACTMCHNPHNSKKKKLRL